MSDDTDDTDDTDASADQQAWLACARLFRTLVAQTAHHAAVHGITPADLKELMEAAGAAYWLTHNAACYDRQLEKAERGFD